MLSSHLISNSRQFHKHENAKLGVYKSAFLVFFFCFVLFFAYCGQAYWFYIEGTSSWFFVFILLHLVLLFFFLLIILYWFCHTLTWIHSPPISLPIPSLWVIPVHQPQAPCLMHQTWTGDLFHIWYFTCFNAILPNHPTLALSHGGQKTVLYICVSLVVSHTGLSLPSF